MAIALFAGLRFGTTLDGIAAGMGAFTAAPTSLRGIHRTRLLATAVSAFGMSSATAIAVASGQSTIAIILVAAGSAYVYGILSSFGEAASAVGLNALVVTIILGNLGVPQTQLVPVSVCVLGGGLVQALLVALVWPLTGHASERRALATAYRALAEYARGAALSETAIPPHVELADVRAALADPQPFGRASDLLALQTLADEAERIRSTLALIAATDAKMTPALPEATSDILNEIAAALQEARSPKEIAAWHDASERIGGDASWERLYGQLRGAWRSAAFPAAGGRAPSPANALLAPHVERWWPVLRSNLSPESPFGRHALRLALAIAVAVAVFRLTHVERGYWIALTAAIVLRPDFTTTYSLGVARIAGTLIGGVLAWAVSLVVPPNAHVAAAIAFAGLGLIFLRVSPAFFAAGITGFVVYILSLAGLQEAGAAVARFSMTLAGGVLGLVVFSLWPTWQAPLTRAALADLIDVIRSYIKTVFAVIAGDEPLDMSSLEARQHAAWTLRTQIATSIERMLSEPRSASELTPRRAVTIVASTQRLGLACLALTSMLDGGRWKPMPAVRKFAAAMDAALGALIDGLRQGPSPRQFPDLRHAYVELARDAASSRESTAQVVLAQADLMVDSANTIAETLDVSSP